jgi:hypothetical protein
MMKFLHQQVNLQFCNLVLFIIIRTTFTSECMSKNKYTLTKRQSYSNCREITVFQLIWGKTILLYRSNALLPPPTLWTEPKILIQTHHRGGSMHYQNGVRLLSLIFKGGGKGPPIFLVSKRMRRCVLFLPYFDKIFLRFRSSGSANESVA